MEITKENAKKLYNVLSKLDELKKARNVIKNRINTCYTEEEREKPWVDQPTDLKGEWMEFRIISERIDTYLEGLMDGGFITGEEYLELREVAYGH